ncbi:hypothetical protein ASPZODRAFT_37193, partial [Penicilliopsis zonata CBS 506.65]
GDVAMKWLRVMDTAKNRNSFTWPHMREDGTNSFRLSDHVWIWSSIKAISILLNWEKMIKDDRKDRTKRKGSLEDPASFSTQRIPLMHNTRSPRETRFEFHDSDTVLFYPLVAGQKMLEPKQKLWSRLIQIQKRFLSAQEVDHDNPLRYGLEILTRHLGVSHPASKTTPDYPSRMLYESMLPSGLFPEQITNSWGVKSNIDHQDHLLHVPFEIAFLLYTT